MHKGTVILIKPEANAHLEEVHINTGMSKARQLRECLKLYLDNEDQLKTKLLAEIETKRMLGVVRFKARLEPEVLSDLVSLASSFDISVNDVTTALIMLHSAETPKHTGPTYREVKATFCGELQAALSVLEGIDSEITEFMTNSPLDQDRRLMKRFSKIKSRMTDMLKQLNKGN